MIKVIKTNSVILYLFILFSCNASSTAQKHDKAIIYLNKITKIQEPVNQSEETFSDYFANLVPIVKNSANSQLDQSKLDSLNNLYNLHVNSINKAIFELSELGEFDSEFNITKHYINYLNIIKNTFVSTIPNYLEFYRNGQNSASDSLKTFISKGSEITRNGELLASKDKDLFNAELMRLVTKYNLKVGQ